VQTPCSSSPLPPDTPPNRSARRLNASKLVAALAATLLTAYLIGPYLDLRQLANHENQLRLFCNRHPATALAAAFVVYTTAAGLSLPAATALTVACGWIFGFWPALALVSFASTAGASLAFLASRLLFRDYIANSYLRNYQVIQQSIDQDGVQYLLMLRLVPLLPFFVVNLLMGLTNMRLRTFWWVSQLGMFPATAVYVAAGAATPSLDVFAQRGLVGLLSPKLLAALVTLGLMPIGVRLLTKRFIRKVAPHHSPAASCSERTR
jgi:uncharacterized membrane protein YdjX (TVP38/TMEM64 family)